MSILNFGTSSADANRNDILQEAIGAYTDEAYTNAKKLSGTAIVGGMANIDPSTETFIGQTRWRKPISMAINVASLSDSTAGTTSQYDADYLKYVKTVRTYGGEKVNMREVVTQVDGLAKIGRDFGEVRGQDGPSATILLMINMVFMWIWVVLKRWLTPLLLRRVPPVLKDSFALLVWASKITSPTTLI